MFFISQSMLLYDQIRDYHRRCIHFFLGLPNYFVFDLWSASCAGLLCILLEYIVPVSVCSRPHIWWYRFQILTRLLAILAIFHAFPLFHTKPKTHSFLILTSSPRIKLVPAVTLFICVPGMRILNLHGETLYPDVYVSWLFSVPTQKYCNSSYIETLLSLTLRFFQVQRMSPYTYSFPSLHVK
jgi:hypothetical protein